MRLIEQRRELAKHRARFGHLGELDIALENTEGTAFENQKPPGFGTLGQHDFAGVKAFERKRGKLALPNHGLVDRSHVGASPFAASINAHRGPFKKYYGAERTRNIVAAGGAH